MDITNVSLPGYPWTLARATPIMFWYADTHPFTASSNMQDTVPSFLRPNRLSSSEWQMLKIPNTIYHRDQVVWAAKKPFFQMLEKTGANLLLTSWKVISQNTYANKIWFDSANNKTRDAFWNGVHHHLQEWVNAALRNGTMHSDFLHEVMTVQGQIVLNDVTVFNTSAHRKAAEERLNWLMSAVLYSHRHDKPAADKFFAEIVDAAGPAAKNQAREGLVEHPEFEHLWQA